MRSYKPNNRSLHIHRVYKNINSGDARSHLLHPLPNANGRPVFFKHRSTLVRNSVTKQEGWYSVQTAHSEKKATLKVLNGLWKRHYSTLSTGDHSHKGSELGRQSFTSKSEQRSSMDWSGEQLNGIRTREDLYSLFAEDVNKQTNEKTRHLLDWIAKHFGVEKQEDWYSISLQDVKTFLNRDDMLLRTHPGGTLFKELRYAYPEYEWSPLLFHNLNHSYWTNHLNQRELMDWVAEQLHIETYEDWYDVTEGRIKKAGGGALLADYYNNSIPSALKHIYPEFSWNAKLFGPLAHEAEDIEPVESHTDSTSTETKRIDENERLLHRKKLDFIAKILGIEEYEEWYLLGAEELKQLGGSNILADYNESFITALRAVYPEFDWDEELLTDAPGVKRIHPQLIKESLDEVFELFHRQIKGLTSSKIFARISRKFGGRLNTLRTFYPELAWVLELYGSEGEDSLEKMLRTFAKVEKQKKIQGYSLDFYLPEFNLALEFQGGQHYKQTYRGSLTDQQGRDERKKQALTEYGITLVEIPYWWNRSFVSLVTTIQKQNPELAARISKVMRERTGSANLDLGSLSKPSKKRYFG